MFKVMLRGDPEITEQVETVLVTAAQDAQAAGDLALRTKKAKAFGRHAGLVWASDVSYLGIIDN